MTTTPTWIAATTGQLPLANQINQFLGPHQMQMLYPSVQKAAQTTAGAGATQSNGLYIAQSFTTAVGQTTIGYVLLTIGTAGGLTGLAPTTLTLRANNAGAPSTTILATTSIAAEYVAMVPTAIVSFPLPVTGLTASTTYWLVIAAAGDPTHHYDWSKSNQVSGTSTSPDGVTWTAQAYGSLYQVWDQTIVGSSPLFTWEDAGARWVWFGYNTNGTMSSIGEYTSGQTTNGYAQSFRSPTYTSGKLTGAT